MLGISQSRLVEHWWRTYPKYTNFIKYSIRRCESRPKSSSVKIMSSSVKKVKSVLYLSGRAQIIVFSDSGQDWNVYKKIDLAFHKCKICHFFVICNKCYMQEQSIFFGYNVVVVVDQTICSVFIKKLYFKVTFMFAH